MLIIRKKSRSSLLPLLAILSALSKSEGCTTSGNLTYEIDELLFPQEDYKTQQGDKKSLYNVLHLFKMNHCVPLFIHSTNILVIHGPNCQSVPVKIDKTYDINTKISIKWTNIQILDKGSFESWNGITHLDVSNNDKLEKLSKGAFNGLPHLEKLSINDNKRLNTLEEDTFISLIKLKELSLVRNNFLNIYDVTKGIKVSTVPSIYSIDLSGNPIETLKQHDFITMTQLNIKKIILKQIQLKEIGPEPFNKLASLTHLELGSPYPNENYIGLLKSLNKNKNLSVLSLNNIDMFENTEILVKTLTEYSYKSIILKGARINTFEITKDVRVERLNHIELSNSFIPFFPKTFFNSSIFPSIEKVIMKNNGFQKIPHQIATSPVQLIDLSGNILHMLSNNSFNFAPDLEILILSDTSLQYIDIEAFADNKKLIFLDLSKNNFIKSSKEFNEDMFKNLNNLQALDLSQCGIQEFGNNHLFDYLKNLQFLSLKSNFITKIDLELFEPLTCLRKLDLRYNRLLFLDESIIEKYPIKDIGLFSSIYRVDKELKQFLHRLITSERDNKFKNCTHTRIVTQNLENQIANVEFKARTSNEKASPCTIYVIEPNAGDNIKESTTKSYIDTIHNNITTSDVTMIEQDHFDFVYVLFRPYYVYNSLSYKTMSILRFLYVFTFYLIILLILSLIAIKLVQCASCYRKSKRQAMILDNKLDYNGIENKAFTIPYEKMKDETLPQKL